MRSTGHFGTTKPIVLNSRMPLGDAIWGRYKAVTYKGGHNRVHGSHYAHMGKPAPAPVAKHNPAPVAKPHNNATWRNTDNARPNMNSRTNDHSNANRQIAQNTSNGSRNSHFGGRR